MFLSIKRDEILLSLEDSLRDYTKLANYFHKLIYGKEDSTDSEHKCIGVSSVYSSSDSSSLASSMNTEQFSNSQIIKQALLPVSQLTPALTNSGKKKLALTHSQSLPMSSSSGGDTNTINSTTPTVSNASTESGNNATTPKSLNLSIEAAKSSSSSSAVLASEPVLSLNKFNYSSSDMAPFFCGDVSGGSFLIKKKIDDDDTFSHRKNRRLKKQNKLHNVNKPYSI